MKTEDSELFNIMPLEMKAFSCNFKQNDFIMHRKMYQSPEKRQLAVENENAYSCKAVWEHTEQEAHRGLGEAPSPPLADARRPTWHWCGGWLGSDQRVPLHRNGRRSRYLLGGGHLLETSNRERKLQNRARNVLLQALQNSYILFRIVLK